MTDYQGPSWDNSSEYKSIDAGELLADMEMAASLCDKLQVLSSEVAEYLPEAPAISGEKANHLVGLCQQAALMFVDAGVLLGNVNTYASCLASVEGNNLQARDVISQSQQLRSQLAQAYKPVMIFLQTCPDSEAENFLREDKLASERFGLGRLRKLRHRLLPLGEETLLLELNLSGKDAFGSLYTDISTSIKADIGGEKVGLAAASLRLESPEEGERCEAYRAINDGWQVHEESCAAILNHITGWRASVAARRSHTEKVHFLDAALHTGSLNRSTLESMFAAVENKASDVRRVLKLKAKLLGKDALAPWDSFAPPPPVDQQSRETKYTFAQAISLIKEALGSVDSSMADFVEMMVKNHWIEGSVADNKRPGAYCTGFLKSRTPRVYMCYAGGMKDVMTLAHELGHAYHNWVMNDLAIQEIRYPMTLAETASIFSETVVQDYLMSQVKNDSERFQIGWVDCLKAETFLLNIPVRFDFEVAINEMRAQGNLSATKLKQLMSDAWQRWYADAMSETNEMFWASKLHFSIPNLSFYNFPYTFGYLFSLGVYAQKDKLADSFHKAYVDLLRDTGKMTCEEVAAKHLGINIEEQGFWDQSVDTVMRNLADFEAVSEKYLR